MSHARRVRPVALVSGLKDPAHIVVWAGPVLAFNGLHLIISIFAGIIVAWLATWSESGPQLWYVGISLVIYGFVHLLGVMVWLEDSLRAALPVRSVFRCHCPRTRGYGALPGPSPAAASPNHARALRHGVAVGPGAELRR
jgi:hypothetical protein